MRFFKRLLAAAFVIYLLPVFAAAGYWALQDKPRNWRDANWTSSGLLPQPEDDSQAAIYVFSAMTGGVKGAIASHAWIVTKEKGAARYDRYDKMGWGSPIRRNHRPADAFWYSNPPRLVTSVHGEDAERLIPRVERAIAAYPHAQPGAYRIWPGPNSNTFVAHVLREVPELGAVLPPDAVGRDYLPEGGFFHLAEDRLDLHVTLGGYLGLSAGLRSGFEVHLMGLVAGIDIARPALKLPGIGRIGI